MSTLVVRTGFAAGIVCLSLFCKSVSLVQNLYKFEKKRKTYWCPVCTQVVKRIQLRTVPVSLMAFSGHKTMMYTLEVGSTICVYQFETRLRSPLPVSLYFNIKVDMYRDSVVYCQRWRLKNTRNQVSGKKYQPELIYNFTDQG